jgi:hypothetical protein
MNMALPSVVRGSEGKNALLLQVMRAMEVDFLRAEELAAWDACVEARPQGNIYHNLVWKAVTEEGLGHRAYYLRALDSSGQFVGVLPLFLVRGMFGRRLVSVPMRDRGGVLATDGPTASRLVARAIALTRELHCQYLQLRSLEEIDPTVLREHDLHCERCWITTRIDLSPGVEKLWKALDRDFVRWAIGKARKEGMVRKAWALLPIQGSKSLGSWVTRQLS